MKYIIIGTLAVGVISLLLASVSAASSSRKFETICKEKKGTPIITNSARVCLKEDSLIIL